MLNVHGKLIPIITSKSLLPSYRRQDMKCICEKPNQIGLLCTGCSSSKTGLPCTLLCKCDGNCVLMGIGLYLILSKFLVEIEVALVYYVFVIFSKYSLHLYLIQDKEHRHCKI